MEQLISSRYYLLLTFIFIIFYVLSLVPIVKSGDAEALLALKSTIDPFNSLQWQSSTNLCSWQGVKECKDGRITKLVLERLNLTGSLNGTSLNLLDQLRVLSFKGNSISGQIPNLSGLVNLKILYLDNNKFNGNAALCGEQVKKPCPGTGTEPALPSLNRKSNKKSKLIIIVVAASVGGLLLLFLLCFLCFIFIKRKNKSTNEVKRNKGVVEAEGVEAEGGGNGGGDGGSGGGGGFWESEGVGSLVFVGAGDQQLSYSLEDLLKASAETLGRGTMGSTYKAVMESGFIVTVKRLKDARYPRSEEFRRHVELIGRLRHPNLVPLRAYFQAKEERLLVYDYFPNGSLFSLIHGTRTNGGGKPLHWTSCLKIAEDLASGLLYIHQNPGLTHGNLKSSNVLLGPDFESCLTDYGLTLFRDTESPEEPSAATFFYRAPECRDIRKSSTQPADVYSFGVLLLELLTGKTPFQDLVQEHGSDIPQWVRSVREEETESGDEPTSGNETSEGKLQSLLNIAMACIALVPENRPMMREVLKMIRDVRAEAQVSSNSSEHSPGRWSDTIQSLPREEQLSI
ncbi:hypothetical protein E1A91_A04G184000v1 [Gossypium mustelinum]|uniref:Protein kinase domain-containing protein n=1 Tax=Gossypium mustelinum TaxID=34275 RepID=A0A5D2ZSH1_GOSMU|nr:hypothetical protein E1A91_A04G184000v1 [Gossypium mustelinum]